MYSENDAFLRKLQSLFIYMFFEKENWKLLRFES